MKFVITALFAMSFTVGACDDAEADAAVEVAVPVAAVVEAPSTKTLDELAVDEAAVLHVKTALRSAAAQADVVAVVAVRGRRVIAPTPEDESAHTVYQLALVDSLSGSSFERCELTVPGGTVDGVETFNSEYIDLRDGDEYIAFLDLSGDGTCRRTKLGPVVPLRDGVAMFSTRVVLAPAELARLFY